MLPIIRHGEASYPDAYQAMAPMPTDQDLRFDGGAGPQDYTDWRYRVWRSVVDYDGLYDYLDAYRIVEIHFERDDKYTAERELVDLDLLMVVLGLAELQNRMLGPVVCKVLTLRQHAGRPTWVYLPMALGSVKGTYGDALASILERIPDWRATAAAPIISISHV